MRADRFDDDLGLPAQELHPLIERPRLDDGGDVTLQFDIVVLGGPRVDADAPDCRRPALVGGERRLATELAQHDPVLVAGEVPEEQRRAVGRLVDAVTAAEDGVMGSTARDLEARERDVGQLPDLEPELTAECRRVHTLCDPGALTRAAAR